MFARTSHFCSTLGCSENKCVLNILRLQEFESYADVPGFWTSLRVRVASFLKDQGVFEGNVAVLTIAFDVFFAWRMETVDSKTVLFFGNDAE